VCVCEITTKSGDDHWSAHESLTGYFTTMERRRRHTRSPSPTYKLDDEGDTYEPYIPVAQRRQEKLAKLSSLGFNSTKKVAKRLQEEQEEREDVQQEEEVKKEKTRRERMLLLEAQDVQKRKAIEGVVDLF